MDGSGPNQRQTNLRINSPKATRGASRNQTGYRSELYGATEEEREWRKTTKISDIVIDITVWLTPGQGRRPYNMDEGVRHIRELLQIIQTRDQRAAFLNRSEIEDGGEEKLF